jgi:hypothetical protein
LILNFDSSYVWSSSNKQQSEGNTSHPQYRGPSQPGKTLLYLISIFQVRIEDTEEVLHKPLKGNEAPQRLEKWNNMETRLGDAVRGLKEGMGNTLSTGGATEERRGYASEKVGILPKKKKMEQMGTTAVLIKDAVTFFQRVV